MESLDVYGKAQGQKLVRGANMKYTVVGYILGGVQQVCQRILFWCGRSMRIIPVSLTSYNRSVLGGTVPQSAVL